MVTQSDGIRDMADAIITARLSIEPLDADRIAAVINGSESAYAIQHLVSTRARATSLGPAVGYKIGMSTESAQRQYNIAEPISGHVFQSRLLESGAHLPVSQRRRIGVECEIAVRLGADLLPSDAPFEAHRIGKSVESYHAAIEILEDRFVRSHGASIWALAADDMLGFGGVLDERIDDFEPFTNHEGVVTIDGTIRATGLTQDLQGGSPLSGLAWLANRLATEDAPLRSGDVVFCGGITAPTWIESGGRSESHIEASIDGTSRVGLTIEWTS